MFTRINQGTRSRRAFTLVEMMVAMGVAGILAAVAATLTFFIARSSSSMLTYLQLDNDSRNALDIITRDVRQVDYMVDNGYNSNWVQFYWTDPSDGLKKNLKYTYDPAARTLTRVNGNVGSGTSEVLLTNCLPLPGKNIFDVYKRVPQTNSWTPWSITSGSGGYKAQVKALQVRWYCYRQVYREEQNTENVQTTMIVIRNQQ